jgi:hypothetical protein
MPTFIYNRAKKKTCYCKERYNLEHYNIFDLRDTEVVICIILEITMFVSCIYDIYFKQDIHKQHYLKRHHLH